MAEGRVGPPLVVKPEVRLELAFGVHERTPAGYRELGQRYADVMLPRLGVK